MNTKQKKGFTLIELLVVISIIALLLALLMPTLGKAKNSAMIAACSGQLKQWGTVYSSYTNDNKSSFWQGWRFQDTQIASDLWYTTTLKYHNNTKLTLCPAAKVVNDRVVSGNKLDGTGNSRKAWGGKDLGTGLEGLTWCPIPKPGMGNATGTDKYWYPTGSYGENGWIDNKTTTPSKLADDWSNDQRYWRTTTVRGTNKIPTLGDSSWPEANVGQNDIPPAIKDNPLVTSNPGGSQMGRHMIDRHGGTDNWLFMDSSVKNIPIKGLFDLIWFRGYDPTKSVYSWSYYSKRGIVGAINWPEWMASYKNVMEQ